MTPDVDLGFFLASLVGAFAAGWAGGFVHSWVRRIQVAA